MPALEPVEFFFEGRAYRAPPGQSVAAALFAHGVRTLRCSPRARGARGAFCLMGSCQECLVASCGRPVLACQTPVSAGLVVSRVDHVTG